MILIKGLAEEKILILGANDEIIPLVESAHSYCVFF